MAAAIWPGQPFPLGATYDGSGTNFAIFSEAAERIDVCLFDGARETRLTLPEQTALRRRNRAIEPGTGNIPRP